MRKDLGAVDFRHLKTRPTPNDYLICPEGYCFDVEDEVAPVFPVDAEALRSKWQAMVAKQPRTRLQTANPERTQYLYQQRSQYFYFPDFISVEFIPLDSQHSTLALYSRSKYGYSDMGVNKLRLTLWLEQLKADIKNSEQDDEFSAD